MSDEILKKLDKLDDRLDSMDKTLVKQEANLAEHMRRTEVLEESVEYIRKSELKPIQNHVVMVEGVIKFIGFLSVVLGIIQVVIKFTK
jgi:hypothetical protein